MLLSSIIVLILVTAFETGIASAAWRRACFLSSHLLSSFSFKVVEAANFTTSSWTEPLCSVPQTTADVIKHKQGWAVVLDDDYWLMICSQTEYPPVGLSQPVRIKTKSLATASRKKRITLQDFAQVILISNWICMRRVWTPELFQYADPLGVQQGWKLMF